MLYQLSYEVTQLQLEAGQFVGLMCSRERTDEGKKRLFEVRVTRNLTAIIVHFFNFHI